MLMMAATVVQVLQLQDLFYVLLHVLFINVYHNYADETNELNSVAESSLMTARSVL